jgi:hypothetical protein
MTFPFPVANTRKVALTFRANAQDGTDLTTYTFASQAIGPASPDRYVIVCIGSRANSARSISSVTIGGIAATAVVTANNATAGADMAAIYIALVPTGTTASVVVTFSGAMLRCVIGVYSMVQNGRATATNTNTATPSGTTPTTTLTVPSNGSLVAAVWAQSSVSASVTWTGPTEDFDLQPGDTASVCLSGASFNHNALSTAGPVTAVVANIASEQAIATASWGP